MEKGLAGLFGILLVSACSYEGPPVSAGGTSKPPATAASRNDELIGVTMPQGVDVPALTGLGDAELAGIVQSLAEADVEHLILAVSRSSSPEVQSFAREAIVSRRGEATQDLALLDELGIVPSVGPVSDELLREGRDDRASLQALPGAAFDRAFIDHHVALDVRSVAWLDAIAANVESPRLKALVQSDRTSVAGHMREAQHVQQSTWSGR